MDQLMNPEAMQSSVENSVEQPQTLGGLPALIAAARRYITEEGGDSSKVVRRLGEDFAYIHLQDVWNPYKFLRQMEGNPPIRLGTEGFRRELVDDHNPARHYMAFVSMGYWLPYLLAMAVLYLWEIAGYIRYGFKWSPEDMQSGLTGVRHGNAVRHRGIAVLPGLMERDLAANDGIESEKPFVATSSGADSSA